MSLFFNRICIPWLFILCFICLCENSSSANPVCPSLPAPGELAFSLSEAFAPHPDTQAEWYFVVGSLCEVHSLRGYNGPFCENPVGFEVNTFLTNITLANSETFIFTNTIFDLTYGDEHLTVTVPGLPPVYPNAESPFDLDFISGPVPLYTASYRLLSGSPGAAGSLYNLIASTPNMTINLFLRSKSPLMVHGFGGFVGLNLPPPNCDNFIYVSMPQMQTWGTIRLNDDIHFVSGLSWFDHQWGVFGPPGAGGGGWIWVGMHIGSYSFMITLPRINFQLHYVGSIVELQAIDGTMTYGTVTSVQVLANWTSPASGNIYPIELKVFTTLAAATELHIIPYFSEQEVRKLLAGQYYPIWESDSMVRVLSGTLRDEMEECVGNGQLELVGYTPHG